MSERSKYWAAKPPQELISECDERRSNWLETFAGGKRYGDLLGRSAKTFSYYYGIAKAANSFELSEMGELGSAKTLYVNLIRYLVDYTISLVTAVPAVFAARPENSDSESYDALLYSQALLDYAADEKGLEAEMKEQARWGFLMGEGVLLGTWEDEAGEAVLVDEEGGLVQNGDIQFEVFGPPHVARERMFKKKKDDWFIFTRYVNKFDLAAKFPVIADEILDAQPANRHQIAEILGITKEIYPDELIPVHTLMHERTPALPDGLEFAYIEDGPFLYHAGLPYRTIPAVVFKPSVVLGTDIGYSNVFDLLGLQDAYNAILSNVLTNYIKFGLVKFQVPSTSNLQPEDVAGANKIVFTNTGDEVKLLPIATHNQEMLQTVGALQSLATQQMGQNDASTGQIASSSRLSSDVVSTMMQQSIQYLSEAQSAYKKAIKDCGKKILEVYRERANYPRVLKIVGKNRARFVDSFVGTQMLAGIDRIQIDLAQADFVPLPVRAANVAMFMQYGLVKSVEQVAQYMLTGKIEQELEVPAEIWNSIKRENEMLRNGEKPEVLIVEDPVAHIRGHAADILADPNAKKNPIVMQAFTDHIMEHVAQVTQIPPELGMLFGHTPLGGQPVDPAAAEASMGGQAPEPTGAEIAQPSETDPTTPVAPVAQ